MMNAMPVIGDTVAGIVFIAYRVDQKDFKNLRPPISYSVLNIMMKNLESY